MSTNTKLIAALLHSGATPDTKARLIAGVLSEPTPKLRAGMVYSGDNGERICIHCAGASALYTGRDLSGQKVDAFTEADAREWEKMLGKPLACEAGCTVYGKASCES